MSKKPLAAIERGEELTLEVAKGPDRVTCTLGPGRPDAITFDMDRDRYETILSRDDGKDVILEVIESEILD